MTEECDADSVGSKKPPKRHQFQPGQSGNPTGRPKGTRNLKSDLREELAEIITIREGGRDISMSKQRALIKRLVNSAIDGDARAINTLMSFCARAFRQDDNGEQQQAPDDCEIVKTFEQRQTRRHGNAANRNNSSNS
jgi:hypothetical protein